MITRISLDNALCTRGACVNLSRLNIMLGDLDGARESISKALLTLSALVNDGPETLRQAGRAVPLSFSDSRPAGIEVDFEDKGRRYRVSAEIYRDQDKGEMSVCERLVEETSSATQALFERRYVLRQAVSPLAEIALQRGVKLPTVTQVESTFVERCLLLSQDPSARFEVASADLRLMQAIAKFIAGRDFSSREREMWIRHVQEADPHIDSIVHDDRYGFCVLYKGGAKCPSSSIPSALAHFLVLSSIAYLPQTTYPSTFIFDAPEHRLSFGNQELLVQSLSSIAESQLILCSWSDFIYCNMIEHEPTNILLVRNTDQREIEMASIVVNRRERMKMPIFKTINHAAIFLSAHLHLRQPISHQRAPKAR